MNPIPRVYICHIKVSTYFGFSFGRGFPVLDSIVISKANLFIFLYISSSVQTFSKNWKANCKYVVRPAYSKKHYITLALFPRQFPLKAATIHLFPHRPGLKALRPYAPTLPNPTSPTGKKQSKYLAMILVHLSNVLLVYSCKLPRNIPYLGEKMTFADYFTGLE